jgi:general stress protein 26
VLVPDQTLSWPEVAAHLAAPRNYWLCTTTSSGAPHAAPVWGVVTGQVLYLYSERRTVKARNLAADPRVVLHLESGEDVVIMRGTAQDLAHGQELSRPWMRAVTAWWPGTGTPVSRACRTMPSLSTPISVSRRASTSCSMLG